MSSFCWDFTCRSPFEGFLQCNALRLQYVGKVANGSLQVSPCKKRHHGDWMARCDLISISIWIQFYKVPAYSCTVAYVLHVPIQSMEAIATSDNNSGFVREAFAQHASIEAELREMVEEEISNAKVERSFKFSPFLALCWAKLMTWNRKMWQCIWCHVNDLEYCWDVTTYVVCSLAHQWCDVVGAFRLSYAHSSDFQSDTCCAKRTMSSSGRVRSVADWPTLGTARVCVSI